MWFGPCGFSTWYFKPASTVAASTAGRPGLTFSRMATYGKRRHILPMLSAPRDPGASAESKRHKASIHSPLPCSMSTTYGTNTSSTAALSRRDSIDELADILLDDTLVADRRVEQALKMNLSDGIAVSDNNRSKARSHPKYGCTQMALHGSSQGHLAAKNYLEPPKLVDERLEETSSMNAARADDYPLTQHGILQPKPFTPYSVDRIGNMEAMATASVGFKPDNATSLHHEEYPLVSGHHLMMSNKLDEAAKLDNWQVERSKTANFIENGGSTLPHHIAPQAKSPPFDPSDINNKIAAMMVATKALKPDGAASLRPGPYSPANGHRSKDGNVLTKMKTAMNHHFQARTNKKSPEPAEAPFYKEVIPQLDLTTIEDRPQSARAIMERRMNEGDNLKNPKIFCLTGHGKIRRKPLPDDGKYLRNQNLSSFHLTQSASEPVLELSSDRPRNNVGLLDEDNDTEPFPPYDRDYDIPFSSSPIAQSTPRIHVHHACEDVRVKSTRDNTPSPFEIGVSGLNEYYSDMDLDKVEMPAGVRRRPPLQRGGPRASGRSGPVGRMKKHPSPSKAQLERWEDLMNKFPTADLLANFSQEDDDLAVNVSLHPMSTVLGNKSTNAKLQDPTQSQDRGTCVDVLQFQLSDAGKVPAAVEDVPSRNKGRKSFVAKHRTSKTRSRESSTRSGRPQSCNVPKEDNPMDIDELQWDEPGLLKKAS